MINYYKILGLENGASLSDIEASYNKLSKELDPANNDNQEFFVEEFKLLQEAYKALTGKKPEEQKEADINTSDISDVFENSDSLVSILKKFRASEDAKKLEIIKSLEAFKSNNETYQQALSMLYKKEDIKHLESAAENTKSTNLKVPKESVSSQNTNDKTPKKKKDSYKKSNKTLLLILAFGILFFGVPYIYFLTKVHAVKNELPRVSKNSEFIQNESKTKWQSKFYEDHPEIVANHLTDNTNKGFYYKEDDRSYTKDTLVSFFLYKKAIPVTLYHSKFFQCVYQNSVNSNSFWRHYTVGLSSEKAEKKSKLPYFRMRNKVRKKFRVTDKEFEDLIALVGGLKVFQKKYRLFLDFDCSKCIKNYTTKHITNDIAINEFYEFALQYLENKRNANNSNQNSLKKYNKDYRNLTSGMSRSLKEKLKKKIAEKPLITSENKKFNYLGSAGGIGEITYTFKNSEYDLKPRVDFFGNPITPSLSGYVNEIYAAYYSENSLYTGATPYKYCYGSNNNGYPSQVKIKSGASDVIVTIKRKGKVYRHAYIKANSNYTFKVADGSYNVYFYYGKGWNPKKFMKNTNCGRLVGGFVSKVSVGKDMFLQLNNQYMTYTLTSVSNGNFSPQTSSIDEAF